MPDIKIKYDAEEDIAIVLASLADDTPVASSEIDNSADLYEDYLVRFSIKTNATGVSSSGKIWVYAVGAIDDSGKTYPSNLKSGRQLGLPMVANVNGSTFTSNVYSVKAAFDGVLPKYFRIVIDNQTGAALDSTENDHDKRAQGLWRQIV